MMNKFHQMRTLLFLRVFLAVLLAITAAQVNAYNQHGYRDQAAAGIAAHALPVEAREIMLLIRQGGPFRYTRDGVVFGNFEKRLPQRPRSYYHEYTVPTPGVRSRGARRLVCGQPSECYYSEDHYETFKRILE